MLKRMERGDTIIEVLFAIAVFSLIAVGGISIMNQGTALAQRALEINLVRQQIDGQAEALRYLNQAYVADFGKNGKPTEQWNKVTVSAVGSALHFDNMTVSGKCANPPAGAFAIDVTKLAANPLLAPTATPATYAKVRYDGALPVAEGIWVQAVKAAGNNFYDFHIRACWVTPGRATPMTLGTIVRLYEPAS